MIPYERTYRLINEPVGSLRLLYKNNDVFICRL